MQIVIEIPEEDYKWVCEQDMGFELYKMIANGTPLPKGHGRLIDADYLREVILLHNFHANNKYFVPYPDRKGYRLRDREVDESIINAPTIIEADKEVEE